MGNFKYIPALAILATLLSGMANAQPPLEWERAPLRNEFVSYSQREIATAGDRTSERHFMPLTDFTMERDSLGNAYYTTVAEIPFLWLDREIFLHTEGGRNTHRIYVNGQRAGAARDSRLPSEFNIASYIHEGSNLITIAVLKDTQEPEGGITADRADLETVFIYSQPRIRIGDYDLTARRKSPGSDEGEIWVEVITLNGYNYPETVKLGFDIYGPDGTLQNFDVRDITIQGRGADTIRLRTTIYGLDKKLWTPSNPQLFRVMMFIRRNGIITEYVPAVTAFTEMEYADGELIHDGNPVSLKTAQYNVSADPDKTVKEIKALKKHGINTVLPDYPQPHWFYEICDREGMYVVDQANIHTPREEGNLKVGGTLSNDPAWLPEYLERAQGAYYRTRNHPCVIGFSLGGPSGNGYNMQKTYLRIKDIEPARPVIYRWANGEWNSDAIAITPAGGH